jgi:hypothetical protein
MAIPVAVLGLGKLAINIAGDLFSKQRASKAIAGGVVGAGMNASDTLASIFTDAVLQGVAPSVEQLGQAVGQLVAGYLIGFILVWISKANQAAPKPPVPGK